MANYTIRFYGSDRSNTQDETIEAYCNADNEIFITMCGSYESHIVLDIPTAIKFAKTIRTEINKAKACSNE